MTGARCHVKEATGAGSGPVDLWGLGGERKGCLFEQASGYEILFDVSEVPGFDPTLVTSTEEQICGGLVPADDIHVDLVGAVDGSRTGFTSYPDVPNADRLIG